MRRRTLGNTWKQSRVADLNPKRQVFAEISDQYGNKAALLLWKNFCPMFPFDVKANEFLQSLDGLSTWWTAKITAPEG